MHAFGDMFHTQGGRECEAGMPSAMPGLMDGREEFAHLAVRPTSMARDEASAAARDHDRAVGLRRRAQDRAHVRRQHVGQRPDLTG